MALNKISKISSGIYYQEVDLTVVQQAAGTFAGAMLGLTEKGPAFQILTSTSFTERVTRFGDLNPLYPSSYYAREFLEQANNYKEVRILGLEGYNEKPGDEPGVDSGNDKCFAIIYNTGSVSARTPLGVGGTTPVTASAETIAAILKPRRQAFTGYGIVDYVEITTILQRDGVTTDATDDLFNVHIVFETGPVTYADLNIPCSLRPEAKEYIGKVFGYDPRDTTKVQGIVSPLWVEFTYPSKTRKSTASGDLEYYYPGDTSPQLSGFLSILTGDMTVQTGFTYTSVTPSNIAVGTTTTVTAAGHGYVNGTPIIFTGTSLPVGNVSGITSLDNSIWYVGNVSGANFDIYTDDTLTTLVDTTSGVFVAGTVRKAFISTWEDEVMTLGGTDGDEVEFQTPISPWLVSDADANGDVKRLFRIWSISDGEAANTEIKIELSNINPDGNIGLGSFDIKVRGYSDREDTGTQIVEVYSNLTMNPASDNYILRRIGDGETFPLKSRYIFVELNEEDTLPNDVLPYGIEGYIGTTGIVTPDVVWTNQYDLSKPLTKQILGLPNNRTNMFAELQSDMLSYKNVASLSAATGKGFHLNPNNNTNISTALFTLCDTDPLSADSIYRTSPTNATQVTGLTKVARNKFVFALAGGFDAFNVYQARDWGTSTSKDYEALQRGLEILSDAENLEADFSVLVTPDFNFQDHALAVETTLEMVEGRGDALYLPDFRYELDPVPDNAKLDLENSNILSNYDAIYYPWVQIEDSTNKVNLWLPPSVIALATIAATATNENVWQPPAGSLRTITQHLVRTRKRMKLNDREILKSANINPITEFPGSGFEITETRTTQEVFSALSFVHNRLLLNYAKKALNQVLRPLLHQLNTPNLRNAFVNAVNPIFDRIKKLNGVEEFKVSVIDQENDRTTLYGVIEIVPLYPVERISVTFTLRNGTLDFNNQ